MTDRALSGRFTSEAAARVAAVFQQECDYVARTLRRLGIPEADLEDVTHDVFVTFHRRLDQYDPSRPVRPWLFGVAFRIASEHRRRTRRRREVRQSDAPEPVSEQPTGEEDLVTRQRRALLRAALETVPLERRAVLVMHDIDRVTMPEIAEVLGIPLNTGYSRLRVARQELAAAVLALEAKEGAA